MNLSETQRTSKLNIDSVNINVNDIGLVFYEKVPRHFRRIVIVTRVLPSRDYEIRGAIVRIATTNTILKRPVKKLFAVENTMCFYICMKIHIMTLIKQITQGNKSLDFEHYKY